MKKNEKKLVEIYSSLPDDAAQQLLEFAEFLEQRHPLQNKTEIKEPLDIPRPEDESVIAAVKRLSETYPMLDSEHLLHETSAIVSEHMLQGKDSKQAVDKLEEIFRQHYDSISQSKS